MKHRNSSLSLSLSLYILAGCSALMAPKGSIGQPLYVPPDHKGQAPHPAIAYFRNDGQVGTALGDPAIGVHYASYGHLLHTFLCEQNKIVFALPVVDGDTLTPDTLYSFSMQLTGETVNAEVVPEAVEQVSWYHNYYHPWCPNGITQVPGFSRVVYREVYPGIDMHAYSNWLGYKLYFVVHPGASPDDILLQFDGQDSLRIDAGVLKAYQSDRGFAFPNAIAYQHIGASTVQVPWYSDYEEVDEDILVKFILGSYDPDYPLILDVSEGFGEMPPPPTPPAGVPEWATYYTSGHDGANAWSEPLKIAPRSNGGIASCGVTNSPGFPVFLGVDPTYNGNSDAFITMFDEHYYRSYSTFWGGLEYDEAVSITEYNSGTAIVGRTSSAASFVWNGPAGSFVDGTVEPGYGPTCFINAFDDDGISLWRTLFGPFDALLPVGIDTYPLPNGVGLVVGGTVDWWNPWDFPVEYSCTSPTINAMPICGSAPAFVHDQMGYGPTVFGTPPYGPCCTDMWLAKFDQNFALTWSTLFSGSSWVEAMSDLTIDNSNDHLVIVGTTSSPGPPSGCASPPFLDYGFPWCISGPGYFQPPLNWNFLDPTYVTPEVAFIADFNADNQLVWCTPFSAKTTAGASNEQTAAVAVDARDGRIAMIGRTSASLYASLACAPPNTIHQFPVCNASCSYNGVSNPGPWVDNWFIAQFNSGSFQLTWSSFVPGCELTDVAVGPAGTVFVAGHLTSTLAPLQWNPDYYSEVAPHQGSGYDGLIAGFDANGKFWGTRWAGLDGEWLRNVVVTGGSEVERVYVGGVTESDLYPELYLYHCPPTMDPSFPPWCQPQLMAPNDVFYGQAKKDLLLNVAINDQVAVGSMGLLVYPNPTDGSLMLACTGGSCPEKGFLSVIDASARLVIDTGPLTGGPFDVSSLAPGAYLAIVRDEQMLPVASVRFIIRP